MFSLSVVSGISQYITPAADDQFQYFRLSNPIPFNGTKSAGKEIETMNINEGKHALTQKVLSERVQF